MNHDELAFFNQQLAGMLKSGIPLEGAIRQLCANMRKGKLRSEFEQLEADLAKGMPLDKALAARKLPELYVRMVQIGAKSNDLPGVLTLLANYYQHVNGVLVRLKGLMVYPVIVLFASAAVSILLASISTTYFNEIREMLSGSFGGSDVPGFFNPGAVGIWVSTLIMGAALAGYLVATIVPAVRSWVFWNFPGFKEASLAQFARSIAVLMHSGATPSEALALVSRLNNNNALKDEAQLWQARLAAGLRRFPEIAAESRTFPPLFLWLVSSSDDNWPEGFNRAAEIYHARALHRIETLLYAALPLAVLLLGFIILVQFVPMVRVLGAMFRSFEM